MVLYLSYTAIKQPSLFRIIPVCVCVCVPATGPASLNITAAESGPRGRTYITIRERRASPRHSVTPTADWTQASRCGLGCYTQHCPAVRLIDRQPRGTGGSIPDVPSRRVGVPRRDGLSSYHLLLNDMHLLGSKPSAKLGNVPPPPSTDSSSSHQRRESISTLGNSTASENNKEWRSLAGLRDQATPLTMYWRRCLMNNSQPPMLTVNLFVTDASQSIPP